jgi:Zn-dependent protease
MMDSKRSLHLGTFLGLEIRVKPSAMATAVLMAGGFYLLLQKGWKWRPWMAVPGGILATAIHYLSEFWHQLGHARAAEQTGFPMKGVTYFGPLALSVYPKNEGLLTAETHIQRALGGPIFSLLLTLATGLVALLFRPIDGLPLFLAVFSFLDNLLVFTIGALLPLGFTDGSTILTWWNQRKGGRFSV